MWVQGRVRGPVSHASRASQACTEHDAQDRDGFAVGCAGEFVVWLSIAPVAKAVSL